MVATSEVSMRMPYIGNFNNTHRIISKEPGRRRIEHKIVVIESVLPRKVPSVDNTVIPDRFRVISDRCFQVMSEEVNPCGQRSRLL